MARPAGTLDVASALTPAPGPLDARRAAHLLRRTGFGGTPADIARYAALSPAAATQAVMDLSAARAVPNPTLEPMYVRGMTPMENNRARHANGIALTNWWY